MEKVNHRNKRPDRQRPSRPETVTVPRKFLQRLMAGAAISGFSIGALAGVGANEACNTYKENSTYEPIDSTDRNIGPGGTIEETIRDAVDQIVEENDITPPSYSEVVEASHGVSSDLGRPAQPEDIVWVTVLSNSKGKTRVSAEVSKKE